MATVVRPELLDDIKRYGAFDISACFHCGNCTAVCPLTEETALFPRRLIRLGQIGDRERVLNAPETWLCYHCGECSETCPRQAEPGEYMAALRRYATAHYQPAGFGAWFAKSAGIAVLITLLVAIVLGAFLIGEHPESGANKWLFKLVPYEVVHDVGIAVFVLTTLSILAGVYGVAKRVVQATSGVKRGWPELRSAAVETAREIATMRRHLEDESEAGKPWHARPSVVHRLIMYGFLALLVATTLDFIFIALLPLGITTFWPARIIGTIGGVAMLAGVIAAIIRRLRGTDRDVRHSRFADWWILFFLFVLAVTGFWLEVVVTLKIAGAVQDAILLLHAAMAMELVLLMAFTKLAHVVYRPIALFTHFLRTNSGAAG
jgi:ferredoxin